MAARGRGAEPHRPVPRAEPLEHVPVETVRRQPPHRGAVARGRRAESCRLGACSDMTDASSHSSSGMIGLGNMGGRIARRIRDAGRSDPRLRRQRGAGCGGRRSPAEASIAALAAAVGCRVPLASRQLGDRGGRVRRRRAASSRSGGAGRGRSRDRCADLDACASTRRSAERDVAFLDAGISGGAAAAEKGTLTIMVGGDVAGARRERRRSSRRSAPACTTWERPASGHIGEAAEQLPERRSASPPPPR